MTDIVIFSVVFGGFFVLRGIAATIVFYFLLPEDDRCPVCDELAAAAADGRMILERDGVVLFATRAARGAYERIPAVSHS